jgi:hypothetical protein
MRSLHQIVEIALLNLRTLPQRLGTSLVVVVGIAGVVGVLVSVLAMSEGFRHTLASTGRPDRSSCSAPAPTPSSRAACHGTPRPCSEPSPASPVTPPAVRSRRPSWW